MSFLKSPLATDAPYSRRKGGVHEDNIPGGYGKANAFVDRWENAAGTSDIDTLSVRSDNKPYLGGGLAVEGRLQSAVYAVHSAPVDAPFFIANQKVRIVSITEIHTTAGSDGGAVTAVVRKCIDTQAPASGIAVMTGTFNMKGVADTLQTATLSADQNAITLEAGQWLSVDFTGTLTALAGVTITVYYKPVGVTSVDRLDVSFYLPTNALMADKAFFVANRKYTVAAVRYLHLTKGTNGSAVNVQLTKDTSTDAPGTGTDLLTNNSNAGFDCKGANSTAQVGVLVTTAGATTLAAGDRLALDFAGTLTALVGVLVTVSMTTAQALRQEATFVQAAAGATDQAFFTADRDYRVLAISQVHAVAAGGVSTADINICRGTTAAADGVTVISATFDLNGTANTVVNGTLAVFDGTLMLYAGDRLSFDWNHAVQASAGVVATVSLLAV